MFGSNKELLIVLAIIAAAAILVAAGAHSLIHPKPHLRPHLRPAFTNQSGETIIGSIPKAA